MATEGDGSRRKRVSKRTKKSWRKNIDTTDVDNYIEDKLLEERIGNVLEGKDGEAAYYIDTKPEISSLKKKSKKEWAKQPPTCLKILNSYSAVPDPVTKRNRVRTKEERKHPLRKKFEELQRARGILPKRVIEASRQRKLAYLKKKQKPKGLVFNEDVWCKNEETDVDKIEKQWLRDETIRHTLTNTRSFKVKPPMGIVRKKSVLPSVEPPHPGMSYNPAYSDHQNLLNEVVEKELQLLKEEAHIARVTTEIFSKVTPSEREAEWKKEMLQGIVKDENYEETKDTNENTAEYKALNPPTTRENKKTLKQRRKLREDRAAALMKKKEKIDKKKMSDIYKLRFLEKEIEDKEKKDASLKEKKLAIQAEKVGEPKRLGRLKFVNPDLNFVRGVELKGSLRELRPEGNLLFDRFISLQKRNMLAPSVKRTKFAKAKRKRFVKQGFKLDEVNNTTISKRKKKIGNSKVKNEIKLEMKEEKL